VRLNELPAHCIANLRARNQRPLSDRRVGGQVTGLDWWRCAAIERPSSNTMIVDCEGAAATGEGWRSISQPVDIGNGPRLAVQFKDLPVLACTARCNISAQ